MPSFKKHLPEEIDDILDMVQDFRKSGMNVEDACKEAGITASTYHRWQREMHGNPGSVRVQFRGRYVTMGRTGDLRMTNEPRGMRPDTARKAIEILGPENCDVWTQDWVMVDAKEFAK